MSKMEKKEVARLDATGQMKKILKLEKVPSDWNWAVAISDNAVEFYENGNKREEFTVSEALMNSLEYHHKCSGERYYVGEKALKEKFIKVMNGEISPITKDDKSDVRRFLFSIYVRMRIIINNRN